MKKLFKTGKIELFSLSEYVHSFREDEPIFQLPPLQRNSVWNVAQVERLWDSLLRGFPVGSFIVSERQKGDASIAITTNDKQLARSSGYFLLDGQQRTRSILLGFLPVDNKRLWVDLDPKLSFGGSNIDRNDRHFMLRVLTSYQPWGMEASNPSNKISENKKYHARSLLLDQDLHYDYEVELDLKDTRSMPQSYSWPYESNLPVPMDSLIELVRESAYKGVDIDWQKVLSLVPTVITERPNEPTDHFTKLVTSIKDNLLERELILLLQPNDDLVKENEKDPIEVLFTRVNSGGTPLQGEEMAYSLLKSTWDGCYDMVSNILMDDEVGYLLPSTKIVMLATRLARAEMGERDVPNPNIDQFRRWIGREDESVFLDKMKLLLTSDRESGESIFHNVLKDFCNTVLYRGGNDPGMPRKLLLKISHHIYAPVFLWLYVNRDDSSFIEQNRLRIIRYLMCSKLTVTKNDKAGKEAFEKVLKSLKGQDFPDHSIYMLLCENGLANMLASPEEFSRNFKSPDGMLRGWHELYGGEEDAYYDLRRSFWRNQEGRDLLLWFQRKELSDWFIGYNPASSDAYDTPYDEDHILPKAHMIVPGKSVTSDLLPNDHLIFERRRGEYINSLGNYRLWPFWANRSDGDVCQTKKLRVGKEDLSDDISAIELGFNSEDDFFKASAIDLADKEYWIDAQIHDGKKRYWPYERRIAFQNAVEKRVSRFYTELFEGLGFSEWYN